jgi:hypothetical protein
LLIHPDLFARTVIPCYDSVLLRETDLRVNTIGFLAHDLVVLLDPADIVENVHIARTATEPR